MKLGKTFKALELALGVHAVSMSQWPVRHTNLPTMTSAMDLVHVPRPHRAPFADITRRIALAAGLVIFVALVVRIGRDGYIDVTGDDIGFLDALYYASVTVTTTGYGDITAVSTGARLATIVLITPARVLFLILVVSTTVEVLSEQTREYLQKRRWRQGVNNHTVVCGFGATGSAAVADLLSRGVDRADIVVVDMSERAVAEAVAMNLVAVRGDASRREVLAQAGIERAAAVIVAPNRDDTSVLITLTVRDVNASAHIVAAGREQENLHLLRQGGANEVIDATAAVGRLLGLGTHAPAAVRVLDDLLDAGDGLELVEIAPEMTEDGPRVPAGSAVVAVVRDGRRVPPTAFDRGDVRPDDRLVVLRESQ